MGYGHLTADERRLIHQWLGEGYTQAGIGKLLSRDKGTISRELSRNTGARGYRPTQAQALAQARAKRGGRRTFTDAMRTEIGERLGKGWTPATISGRARYEGRAMISREWIYRYIYAAGKAGNDLWTKLPRAKRKRRRRRPRQDGRGRGQIPNQRRIDTRPGVVDKRERIGDWEGDLMSGAPGTGHLATMVERASLFTLLSHVPSKEAEVVNDGIAGAFDARSIPACVRLTMTLDNGKEFALHEALAARTGLAIYFAHPYHSWERGTNENTNGLIRRLLPKGASFAGLDATEIARIETYLNDRPRACLGWRTPREVFYGWIAAQLTG